METPQMMTAQLSEPQAAEQQEGMPQLESSRQSFKAITRIALNNWHYIDSKILTLNKSINFFRCV